MGASFHHSAQGEGDSPERNPFAGGRTQNAQQRAFFLYAANHCPIGAILGFTVDIRTRPDATACGQNASTQASYDDDLVELEIPNIDPD